jgi:hypothetical protein
MTNAVQESEEALAALRRAGEEIRAQAPHCTSGVYRHDIVDEGDKLFTEDLPNQGHPEAAP